MIADIESVRARRYLLGDTNDEETAVIEQKYFEDDEAVDRIAAAEDDLIEDYLAGQLKPLVVPELVVPVSTPWPVRVWTDCTTLCAERPPGPWAGAVWTVN